MIENDLLLKAEQDDVESQYLLGFRYRYGEDGYPQKLDEAFKWLEAAANSNHNKAQQHMAYFYIDTGDFEIVENNINKGVDWLRKSVENGNTDAVKALINLLSTPNVKTNVKEIMELLTTLEIYKNPIAMLELGMVHLNTQKSHFINKFPQLSVHENREKGIKMLGEALDKAEEIEKTERENPFDAFMYGEIAAVFHEQFKMAESTENAIYYLERDYYCSNKAVSLLPKKFPVKDKMVFLKRLEAAENHLNEVKAGNECYARLTEEIYACFEPLQGYQSFLLKQAQTIAEQDARELKGLCTHCGIKLSFFQKRSNVVCKSCEKTYKYITYRGKKGFLSEMAKTVTFGGVQWNVLDICEDRALLLCSQSIINKAYNSGDMVVKTWNNSSLRHYLNNDFFERFKIWERNSIIETHLENADNYIFQSKGSVQTNDKIFILSIDEVFYYFGDCGIKKFAENDTVNDMYKVNRIAEDNSEWWLRSPGYQQDYQHRAPTYRHGKYGGYTSNSLPAAYYAATVKSDGVVNMHGSIIDNEKIGVRPAVWVKLPVNMVTEKTVDKVISHIIKQRQISMNHLNIINNKEKVKKRTSLSIQKFPNYLPPALINYLSPALMVPACIYYLSLMPRIIDESGSMFALFMLLGVALTYLIVTFMPRDGNKGTVIFCLCMGLIINFSMMSLGILSGSSTILAVFIFIASAIAYIKAFIDN